MDPGPGPLEAEGRLIYGGHQQYCNTSNMFYSFLKVFRPQDPFNHVYLIRRSQNELIKSIFG